MASPDEIRNQKERVISAELELQRQQAVLERLEAQDLALSDPEPDEDEADDAE